MVFDKFLIYLRFIGKACRLTRISMRKFTGERAKEHLKKNESTAATVGQIFSPEIEKLDFVAIPLSAPPIKPQYISNEST